MQPSDVVILAYFRNNMYTCLRDVFEQPGEDNERSTNAELNATSRMYERKTPKKRGRVDKQPIPMPRQHKETRKVSPKGSENVAN